MSIAGGVHRALERGRSISCEAVQIFTRNQLRWSAPILREEEIRVFQILRGDFRQLLAHASYLINLASPDDEIFSRSIAALAEELGRCSILGIPTLVLHPGSHRDHGISWGIRRLVEGVLQAFGQREGCRVRLALETTAGSGSSLGGSFEQLRDLLAALENRGVPVGICFDTCHVFAAGYELRTRPGYEATWRRFDETIGRGTLVALHLNDSRGALGSGTDRHEHIGKGAIGKSGFRLLAQDPGLAEVAGILETPKGRDMQEDVENLRLLRSLERRRTNAGLPL
ncbi:MAG: deoxyribonuclease IV [Spirochaetaceae bacterium]|nr:MAG: deoxyribonuclease IV [Spirochaetaceae bacterium]